jgi:hypothetical protein
MGRRVRHMACIVVVFGAVAGLGQTAAGASSVGEPPQDRSATTSEVSGGASSARALVLVLGQGPVIVPPSRAAVVQCSPRGGGTHPRPAQACSVLGAVGGDLQKLKAPAGMVCPSIYQPVTASSVGVWDDHFILSVRTFSNSCELRNTMGAAANF